MKGRFHINKKGEAGKCDAEVQGCPFGGDNDHYDTKEEAQKAYEKKNIAQSLAKKQKFKKTGLRFLAIGGLFVASVNVTGCTINQSHDFFDDGQVEQFKEDTRKMKDDTQRKIEKGVSDYENYGGSSSSGSSSSGKFDPSDIYFQGDPLKPSKDKVEDAKNYISQIVVQDELVQDVDYTYDREGEYGGFKSGVVEEAENRDVTNGTFKDSSGYSRAIGGDFIDPYTGNKVEIVEGDRYDTNVDHIVPLNEVEQSINPNNPLSPDEKVSIANDMDNLQITSFEANQEKKDKDAAEWLPSYEPAQCSYVISVINVKHKYHLTADNSEMTAIKDVLDSKC